MLTSAERKARAQMGGRAMVAKYGRAGMREISRKAAKVRKPGDRTIPTNDELLATPEGRKRATAIARELGIDSGSRGTANPLTNSDR